jgi:phosphomannomutase
MYHYGRKDWPFEEALQEQVNETIRTVRPGQVAGLPVVDISTVDGLRLDLAEGSWLLLRPSGTEPLIRVYAESLSEDLTQTLITEGLRLLGLVS